MLLRASLAAFALIVAPATAGLLTSTPAAALAAGQTIAFGEDPPSGVSQYAAVGVTFGSGSFGIQEGLANGDSGGWEVDGTNDPYFLGFNGPYTNDITFDETVGSVSIDAARTSGSVDGTITLEALSGATVIDSDTAVLGAINTWSTLTVTAAMDGIRITGDGTSFHPFGVDNIVIAGVPGSDPVANAGPDQSVTLTGTSATVSLDGTGSSDPDADPLTYAWSGDFTGGAATGATPEVTFTAAGTHTVTLVVSDGTGGSSTDTVDIVVAAPTLVPEPTPAGGAQPVTAQPSFAG